MFIFAVIGIIIGYIFYLSLSDDEPNTYGYFHIHE
jgi:hypothetical protein